MPPSAAAVKSADSIGSKARVQPWLQFGLFRHFASMFAEKSNGREPRFHLQDWNTLYSI
jgi:hypothetical protein